MIANGLYIPKSGWKIIVVVVLSLLYWTEMVHLLEMLNEILRKSRYNFIDELTRQNRELIGHDKHVHGQLEIITITLIMVMRDGSH